MWTKEKVLEEASKLTTMKELEENKALSSAAFRLGIRDEATKHIPRNRKQYKKDITKKEMLDIAKSYENRKEFQKEHSSLYKNLTKEDLMSVFGPPQKTSIKYSEEFLLAEAKKFCTRNSLKVSNPNIYNIIRKRGLIEKAFEHMNSPKNAPYTYEELRREALKYTTKQAFKLGSYNQYQAACRHTNFKEICSHMVPGKIATNYDKPMWLYVVKITTLDNSIPTVFKVGITKRSHILDRFWIDYTKSKTSIEVLFKHKYQTGKEAHAMEQDIIKEFCDYSYKGPSPLIGTKTTEMFTKNITFSGVGLRACDQSGEPTE